MARGAPGCGDHLRRVGRWLRRRRRGRRASAGDERAFDVHASTTLTTADSGKAQYIARLNKACRKAWMVARVDSRESRIPYRLHRHSRYFGRVLHTGADRSDVTNAERGSPAQTAVYPAGPFVGQGGG